MAVVVGGLGFSGCVGGQSGSEGLCGENGKREMNDILNTAASDEDGGVEDDPDAARNEFVADDGHPEVNSAPTQCISPDEN